MLFAQSAIGSMIGGAYGDTLGAAVEFTPSATIRARYGSRGITVPAPAYGFPTPVITDDTQMAIATARGLCSVPSCERSEDETALRAIWCAYREWYASQAYPQQRRAPGSTCLSALATGRMGTRTVPLNQSAGCGGIMRVHPIGIACASVPTRAFVLGMDTAAITHGHPDGYVPAGALAMCVAYCANGLPFAEAIAATQKVVARMPDNERAGTLMAFRDALEAPITGDHAAIIDSTVGQRGRHGGGWLGHDCLAIALYAIRCAPNDPVEAVRIAVNHGGDSDSTGSVAGAIAGAIHGPDAFLAALTGNRIPLECRETLTALAEQLVRFGMEGTHG